LKRLLNLSIALGTISTASYLLLSGEASAAILYFCNGFAAMGIPTLSAALFSGGERRR
jgi:hypothetical protein